jgi:hypothetical protein
VKEKARVRVNLPMLKRIAFRIAKRRFVDLNSAAQKTAVLCPEETVLLPKAIYLPGALDRIMGISMWRNWNQEKELIFGLKIVAHATKVYFLKNADIAGAYIYSGAAKYRPGFGRETLMLNNVQKHRAIQKASLVTTYAGSLFFGPLLVDDFLLELNAENPGDNIKMVTRPYHHEHAYRQLLGLEGTYLVDNARIGNLTLYEQPAINSLRTKQYRIFRERVRKKYPLYNKGTRPKIYLKRGGSGQKRLLDNEMEIEAMLVREGYQIVAPSELSVDEIVRKTLNADIVISIEGSHLSHVIFTMANNGAFVVLQPPDRFSAVYKEYADCMDMTFAFVVGDKTENGFKVDIGMLLRTIDLIKN